MTPMRVKADHRKLMQSIKRAGKAFGDTTAQATARWGVSVCRDLAKQTQPWGSSAKAGKQQRDAILGGMFACVAPLKRPKASGGRASGLNHKGERVSVPMDRWLTTEAQIHQFIDSHRNTKGRTPKKIPLEMKAAAPNALFNKAKKTRFLKAGSAKGPWIGAGIKLARSQRGASRIEIGASYIRFAQRHASNGDATIPRAGFSPSTRLINRAHHAGQSNVLRRGQMTSSIEWGARNTLNWYRRIMKARLK